MNQFCWILARFLTSTWVGAATLFVITGIREVRHPGFDSATKSALASLRFPCFYAFGMTALILATGFASICLRDQRGGKLLKLAVGLLLASIALMVADLAWIYGPLAEMNLMDPHPAEFQAYHTWSMYINFAGLACSLTAALLLCRPLSSDSHLSASGTTE